MILLLVDTRDSLELIKDWLELYNGKEWRLISEIMWLVVMFVSETSTRPFPQPTSALTYSQVPTRSGLTSPWVSLEGYLKHKGRTPFWFFRGQTEVTNCCLEAYLCCLTGTKPKQWPTYLVWGFGQNSGLVPTIMPHRRWPLIDPWMARIHRYC